MVGTTIHSYKIIQKIGEGGMGTVYLGIHEKLSREVAIKMLLPELSNNQDIKERFLNEAKTLSKLNHQNIVTLYDYAELNNNLFLIMEYISGITISDYINRGFNTDLRKNISLFSQVLDGFDYAHSKGVVHRDIKPSNILINNEGIPKILDFGIAKIVDENFKLTKTGLRMGSVLYMSPEQILGRNIDLRSDIYSLGVTLYELISGANPYDVINKSEYEIQSEIINNILPDFENINTREGEEIYSVIAKATAKDPYQRFQSCSEFKESLAGISSISSGQYGYGFDKTKISPRTPDISSKTQISGSPYSDSKLTKNKNNNKTYLLVSAFVLLIAVAVIMYIYLGEDSNQVAVTEKKSTNNQTQSTKSGEDVNIGLIKSEVTETVNKFLNCWGQKDIACLSSLLTDDYQYETATGRNKYQDKQERISVWEKQFSERKYINVTHNGIEVKVLDKENVTASYYQTYDSDKYSDKGFKVLYLKKINNNWKIFKDSFY